MMENASDVLDIHVGDRVTCRDGRCYVFIGWTRSVATNNLSAWFVCALKADEPLVPTHKVGQVWTYNAVFMEALERRFPSIRRTYGKDV